MNGSGSAGLSPVSVPVLDDAGDEMSLDWLDALYSATVTGAGGNWRVQHRLEGAAGVADLITSGAASFAAEARCPRTLFSQMELSQSPDMEIEFDESMTREPVFVVPGIIAVRDCDLATSDAAVIWRRCGTSVPVAKGTWLARGRARSEDLACSLLVIDEADWLDDHEMSIEAYPDQDGNTRLRILIPTSQRPRLSEKAFIAQAWQAAMAYLPSCEAFDLDSDNSADNHLAAELEAKLSGLALWNDRAAWDPLRAATRLLGMPAPDGLDE